MKLISAPLSMFGAKTEIAAIEKGLSVEVEFVPFSLASFYQPKHEEVLRINPKAQVPVLIDGDLEIFDSTQIFEYFEDVRPEPSLWPTDLGDRARSRLLELKSDEVFFPNVVRLFPQNQSAAERAEIETAKGALMSFYDEMNSLLDKTGTEYLAGPYSYADIAFYMAQFFASFIGFPVPKSNAHLLAWRDRAGSRPAVTQVVGKMRAYLNENGVSTDGF